MSEDPRALLREADKMLSEADKTKSSSWGLSSFFTTVSDITAGVTKADKYENAAGYYVNAAKEFDNQNSYNEAGQAFEKAAQAFNTAAQMETNKLDPLAGDSKRGNATAAANNYAAASNAYGHIDPQKAVGCLDLAIKHYRAHKDYHRTSANRQKEKAEILVKIQDMDGAAKAHETAGDWYAGSGAPALAMAQYEKASGILAMSGKSDGYFKASEMYSKMVDLAIKNDLMRYNVKKYLLKQGIVNLLLDVEDAQGTPISTAVTCRALDKAREFDDFGFTLEFQLIAGLMNAVDELNLEAFEAARSEVHYIEPFEKKLLDILMAEFCSKLEPDFS